MKALKTPAMTAAITWTIAMYPIYPFLGLLTAIIAMGLFFNEETDNQLISA